MNKLMTVLLALLISTSVFAGDGFDKLYSKYSGSDEVTSLNLTKSLIRMASNFIDEKDKDAKELLRSVESIKLLASENGKDVKLIAEAKNMMNNSGYEDLIKINDGGDHVRVMVKEVGDIVKEVIILADSDDEFALISVTGNIDPEQIGKVLQTLDIEVGGLEGLNAK